MEKAQRAIMKCREGSDSEDAHTPLVPKIPTGAVG